MAIELVPKKFVVPAIVGLAILISLAELALANWEEFL
jgi:hypothetical protein